jgi:hypothetical protein
MLVKYWDTPTCVEYKGTNCDQTNQMQDCDAILQPTKWLPSYDEWVGRIHVQDTIHLSLTKESSDENNALNVYWPDHVDSVMEAQIVTFPTVPSKAENLLSTDLIPSNWSRMISRNLYAQGADFLYGMLFFQAFQLGSDVRSALPEGFNVDPDSSQTIALYSQHGNNSAEEIRCLESIVDHSLPCHVYIMSYRSDETLDQLQSWLSSRNCTAWTKRAIDGTKAGFFQDLNFVSKARSAYIGHSTTNSSDLLLEWVEYQSQMETWKQGRYPPLHPKLAKCILPSGASET